MKEGGGRRKGLTERELYNHLGRGGLRRSVQFARVSMGGELRRKALTKKVNDTQEEW